MRIESTEGNEFELAEIQCPTCGPLANERIIGFRGGRYHRHGRGAATQIVQCTRCGLYYPNPFPFPCDIQKLYGDPEKYFCRHDAHEKIERFRELVRGFAAFIDRPVESLLDVGSGRGEMLAAARAEGVSEVVGLEFSEAMIEASAGDFDVRVEPMTIEEFAERSTETFDVVVLNAILEHVFDPDSMISCCRRLLCPGGLLYIDTPNENHLLAMAAAAYSRLHRRDQVYVLSPTFPPYHVFGFCRRSLKILLHKHGFVVEQLRVKGDVGVPSSGGWQDRLQSALGSGINIIANATGLGHNMFVWARLAEVVRE